MRQSYNSQANFILLYSNHIFEHMMSPCPSHTLEILRNGTYSLSRSSWSRADTYSTSRTFTNPMCT